VQDDPRRRILSDRAGQVVSSLLVGPSVGKLICNCAVACLGLEAKSRISRQGEDDTPIARVHRVLTDRQCALELNGAVGSVRCDLCLLSLDLDPAIAGLQAQAAGATRNRDGTIAGCQVQGTLVLFGRNRTVGGFDVRLAAPALK